MATDKPGLVDRYIRFLAISNKDDYKQDRLIINEVFERVGYESPCRAEL